MIVCLSVFCLLVCFLAYLFVWFLIYFCLLGRLFNCLVACLLLINRETLRHVSSLLVLTGALYAILILLCNQRQKYQSSLYFPGMWEGEWWKCSRGWWWILEVLFGKVYACAASLLWLSSVIQHSCMQHDCESWRFWNDRWCGRWITNCVDFSDYNTQEIFSHIFESH